MKIPPGALSQMMQMVTGSLPYEAEYEPKTPEGRALVSMTTAVGKHDSGLSDLPGFVYFLATRIDKSEKKQEATATLLRELNTILEAYEDETAQVQWESD